MDRVLIDTWAYGAHARARAVRATAASAGPTSGTATSEGSNPYANPITGLHFDRRPQHAWSCSRSRTTRRSSEPRDDGRVRAAARAGPARCATTSSRSRSPSPRASRSRSTATCCAGSSGRCGSASTRARGWSSTRVGYEDGGRVRPVAHRLSFAEMVVPYRDPTTDHNAPHGVRHRRVGPRLHDHLARARLRLPRRDPPTSTPSLHDSRGEPCDDPQRDLHPRGGRRRPVEARRPGRGRRGAPRAPARASPSTPRSPTTSTSSTGASTRTATSSARCARPGSWSRAASPRASSRPTARSSTSAPTRRSTSTSSSRGSTSTSTARPTRST